MFVLIQHVRVGLTLIMGVYSSMESAKKHLGDHVYMKYTPWRPGPEGLGREDTRQDDTQISGFYEIIPMPLDAPLRFGVITLERHTNE